MADNDSTREEWRPIAELDGTYEVSSFGRLRSVPRTLVDGREWRGKVLRLTTARGYPSACVSHRGKKVTVRLHRAVASAFCARPDGCDVVNHLDGDRTNNRPANLEWTTHSGNNVHALAAGLRDTVRGERHVRAKLTDEQVMAIRARSNEPRALVAKEFSVTAATIGDIVHRRSWMHLPGPRVD